jgi:competence protein ComEC
METKTKNLVYFFLIPALVLTIAVNYFTQQDQRDWLLHVNFFNIGQGDAFLITTYQGNQVLIDGGPGNKVLEELSEVMPFKDRVIEMMVLTHPHADHVEGLIPVLARYQVKKILLPNLEYDSDSYQEFLTAVENESAEVVYAKQGQRFYLDNATVLDILHPRVDEKHKPADVNDESIVARLIFGKTKMLFTGDAGIGIEKPLIGKFNLDADLLKIGHHGSKHSTSQEFLEQVTPEYSVIQVGKNNYGHPAKEVLEKLYRIKSKIFRTDQESDIEFVSDGILLQKL